MGITGLLKFVKEASRETNISEFNGCTAAIDTYSWLHKGVPKCAEKLMRGEATDIYIEYCMYFVHMLLQNSIKPILVFDGRYLPAKAATELQRRESRDAAREKVAELYSRGEIEEAKKHMNRCVDVTHAMALRLIKKCRKHNVDCIVAPYEADAQLAYLNIKNIAQVVIAEDSDLLVFGCTKLITKLKRNGTCVLVESAKLPLTMKCPKERYSFDKFRRMCILSGCDYLASLRGIGLATAQKFVTATQDLDFSRALTGMPSVLKKRRLVVTDEYRENFLKAEATFKHQYVYDPLERRMVRLSEPDDKDLRLCVNAGELLDQEIAFQLALGNLDPFTFMKMDDWHPDDRINKNAPATLRSWEDTHVSKYPSIWSPEFRTHVNETRPWEDTVEMIIAVPSTNNQYEGSSIPSSSSSQESLEYSQKEVELLQSSSTITIPQMSFGASPSNSNGVQPSSSSQLTRTKGTKKGPSKKSVLPSNQRTLDNFFRRQNSSIPSSSSQGSLENSQKENELLKSSCKISVKSPSLLGVSLPQYDSTRKQEFVVENTDSMEISATPTDNQIFFGASPSTSNGVQPSSSFKVTQTKATKKRSTKKGVLKTTNPSNQPTLNSYFKIQNISAMKKWCTEN